MRIPHTLSLMLLALSTASAQDYWTGAIDNTWDTSTNNWSSDSAGTTPITFTSGDSVIFSADSASTTPTVSTSGTQSVSTIAINTGAVAFAGSGVSITGGNFSVASGASGSFTTNLTLANGTAFAVDGSLDVRLVGGGKAVTKSGAGILTISDTSSSDYSLTITGGTVVLQRAPAAAGKILKGTNVGSGTTLKFAADGQKTNGLTANGSVELYAGFTATVNSLSGSGSISTGAGSLINITGGTFNGNITGGGSLAVTSGTFTLGGTSSMTFTIGANNASNSVSGAGTAAFNGTFNFDLSGADTTDGNSWIITSVTSQSFGGTFAVVGFTDPLSNGVWNNGGGFTFDQSNGMLTYSAIPEPSTVALIAGLSGLLLVGGRRIRNRRSA